MPTPPPHAALFVVVVAIRNGRGGITLTSSTKSAFDAYVCTVVLQEPIPVVKDEMVIWCVVVLKDDV